MKTITLKNKEISYKLRKARRNRYMRLSVYPDGSVSVSVPWHVSQGAIERFLRSRAAWLFDKLDYFKRNPAPTFKKGNKKEYLEYKEKARKLAHERLEYWNQFYGFKWGKVSIRNQKTRWGSCSKQGNLSFNYKITLLPERLADYIIVHELCHLKEFNHSKRFWALVERMIPDAQSLKRSLKLN